MPEYTITETVTYCVEASSRREALDKVFNGTAGLSLYFQEANDRYTVGEDMPTDLCSECNDPLSDDGLIEGEYVCAMCSPSMSTATTCA